MGLTSMTGFARADGAYGAYGWHWEVKSVNGKSLDVRCRMPHGMDNIEQMARKLAANYFRRGNFQIGLQMSREAGDSRYHINETILASIMQAAEKASRQYKLDPPKIGELLALRGVLELVEDTDDDEVIKARDKAIMQSLDEAFTSLNEMRCSEGAHMQTVMQGHLDRIEQLTIEARDCPSRAPQAIEARFAELVSRLLERSDDLDRDRLHAEAIIIATRADVQEELDRLFAHIAAARELVQSDEPVGRKFDFLAQEFNREANTLCSKASDGELSRIGLDMKTTIDQLREQVQNIE